jgi:transposase
VEGYAGRQFVGIDLHRRRSVIVRKDVDGQLLESVQITNSPQALAEVLARAGEAPEVVLEATYGWYWAVDVLQAAGAQVQLAHPLGVKAFEYRRVKNDLRDADDLAELLRLGRLPQAWIAPPVTRELREVVRHRAKLVALRSHSKASVHAVLAKCGISVPVSDLFGVDGSKLLDQLTVASAGGGPRDGGPGGGGPRDGGPGGGGPVPTLPAVYAARVASLRRVMDLLDFEIDLFGSLARGRLTADTDLRRGYAAVQTIPGIGPTLGAVFVAEIGDIGRFDRAEQLTCWAGLTPRHHESDRHVHRGHITKQGSRLVRWAAVESVQKAPKHTPVRQLRDRVEARRGHNIATVAAARRQLELVFYALRDGHVRALSTAGAA